MESVFKKGKIRERANDKNSKVWEQAEFLLALIEIREAIEEGFERLDQTQVEAALMLVGCKESFDTFLETRIQSDKVLSAMLAKGQQGHPIAEEPQKEEAAKLALQVIRAANFGKVPENGEKPDGQPTEENKNRVTLNDGDFGKIASDSGIA